MNDRVKYLLKLVVPMFLISCVTIHLASPLLFAICFVLIYMIGCNTILHRYWAHRQMKMYGWAEKLFSVVSLFALVGDPISFSKTHRWHHRYADSAYDVHRPDLGFFESFVGWQFKQFDPPLTSVKDLLRQKYLLTLAKHQVKIVWVGVLLSFLYPPLGASLVLTMVLSWFLEMLTNYIAHDRDGAKDVKWLAWLSSGPYHRFHHDHPSDIGRNPIVRIFIKLFS
mgnify:CR=1 FL=1